MITLVITNIAVLMLMIDTDGKMLRMQKSIILASFHLHSFPCSFYFLLLLPLLRSQVSPQPPTLLISLIPFPSTPSIPFLFLLSFPLFSVLLYSSNPLASSHIPLPTAPSVPPPPSPFLYSPPSPLSPSFDSLLCPLPPGPCNNAKRNVTAKEFQYLAKD